MIGRVKRLQGIRREIDEGIEKESEENKINQERMRAKEIRLK